MKKTGVCFLLFLISCLSYAQTEDYGLSREDLNLLMGQFMEPRGSYDRSVWVEMSFSWGKRHGVNTNALNIIIDYNKSIAGKLGSEYEQYLTLNATATHYIIRRIEKTREGQFLLYLIYIDYKNVPKEAGAIKITFLDSQHLLIDNSLFAATSWEFRGILWRVAGIGEKIILSDLPDAKL
jgi:hypothetical protein